MERKDFATYLSGKELVFILERQLNKIWTKIVKKYKGSYCNGQ